MALRRYIAKRILHSIFVLWAVATVVFLGMRFIPGGPATAILGRRARPSSIRQLREQMGLNDPLPVQYVDWLAGIVVGDFGRNFETGAPVTDIIAQAAPKTFSIAVVGLLLGLAIAIPAGILSATRKNSYVDYFVTVVAFLGISMPAFFIGILLAWLFGVHLGWLPVIRYVPLSEGFVPWAEHIILPGIAVGVPYAAIVMRMMRSSLLETLDEQYIETARAKGVDPQVRLFKHALQNSFISVLTILGIQLAVILVGSVTVEIVFGIKGLGRVFVNSLQSRQYTLTQAGILLVAAVMVTTNLVVDILYTVIDPRIRYGDES
ncbi:MAG: peptide/nickel transport system permease protein [Haloarculaceae archaeon]|jgi:peptide/nickel transport system permease protein